MTGNFFDTHLRRAERDHRPQAQGRRRARSAPENAWIGQNPDTGFREIGPWIVPDPGIADPSLTLAAAPPAARRGGREAARRPALPGLARRRAVPQRLPRGDLWTT